MADDDTNSEEERRALDQSADGRGGHWALGRHMDTLRAQPQGPGFMPSSTAKPKTMCWSPKYDVHSTEEAIDIMRSFVLDFALANYDELQLQPAAADTRRRLHKVARKFNLLSHSTGTGAVRHVLVRRKYLYAPAPLGLTVSASRKTLRLSGAELRLVDTAIAPVTAGTDTALRRTELNTVADLVQPNERNAVNVCHASGGGTGTRVNYTMGRLPNSRLLPVSPPRRPADLADLPVHQHRDDILAAIRNHTVTIVSGGTGCGKTTQIPQYVLDDCASRGARCRIVVTQPRRLPAIAAAQRVAYERGETVGDTVGYHIRLERRLGPRTVLTFCTPGVLLRTLHTSDRCNEMSHIFLDEVHEREQQTDFLLALLRRRLAQPAAAAGDSSTPPFRLVLMSATLDADLQLFEHYFSNAHCTAHVKVHSRMYNTTNIYIDQILLRTCYARDEVDCGRPGHVSHNDYEEKDAFGVRTDTMPDDVPSVPGPMRWDAVCMSSLCAPYADVSQSSLAAGLHRRYELELQAATASGYACAESGPRADTKLVAYVVAMLLDNAIEGGVLVFLPGYEDISTVRSMLLTQHVAKHCGRRPELFVLHSEMDAHNQANVFKPVAHGCRKVILSTNIAEASLTIEDVVFVVDCGYIKEKRFAHGTHISLLSTVTESKTNAIQRSGRAGRCRDGYCIRLFTREQYERMEEAQQPEMQRIAIHELCLQARYLAPVNESVSQFLHQCPQPPPHSAIADAVNYLQALGCMRSDESLTSQGHMTAELPLSAGHARSLLFAAYLRCLEPVLQLVAMLTYRDPFVLTVAERRADARSARLALANGDTSEHLPYLRAFQKYIGTSSKALRDAFMQDHFISPPNMSMALRIRNQLKYELERVGVVDGDLWPSLNTNAQSWPLVKACMVAGAYPCIGFLRNAKRFNFVDTIRRDKVQVPPMLRRLQPTNCIGDFTQTFVFFDELSESANGEATMRQATLCDSMYAALFAGRPCVPANLGCEQRPCNSTLQHSDTASVFMVDEAQLAFSCRRNTCERLNWLRLRLIAGFMRYLGTRRHHGLHNDDVVNAVETLVSNADLRANVDLANIQLSPAEHCAPQATFWQKQFSNKSALCDVHAPDEPVPVAAVLPDECERDEDKVKKWLDNADVQRKPSSEHVDYDAPVAQRSHAGRVGKSPAAVLGGSKSSEHRAPAPPPRYGRMRHSARAAGATAAVGDTSASAAPMGAGRPPPAPVYAVPDVSRPPPTAPTYGQTQTQPAPLHYHEQQQGEDEYAWSRPLVVASASPLAHQSRAGFTLPPHPQLQSQSQPQPTVNLLPARGRGQARVAAAGAQHSAAAVSFGRLTRTDWTQCTSAGSLVRPLHTVTVPPPPVHHTHGYSAPPPPPPVHRAPVPACAAVPPPAESQQQPHSGPMHTRTFYSTQAYGSGGYRR